MLAAVELAAKPMEEEIGPAADSDGSSLLATIPRHPAGQCHSRGPVANGLGSGWSEMRDSDVVRAGLQRVEGADILRSGQTWAEGQDLDIGRRWFADSCPVSDLDNGIFQVTAWSLFRKRPTKRESPNFAPWNP